MKRVFLEKGHLLGFLLAVLLLIAAFLPHYRLTTNCDGEMKTGEYGVGVVLQLARAVGGVPDEAAQPLLVTEGLLDSMSLSQEGLLSRTLWPLAATGIGLIGGAVLLVLTAVDSLRNRPDKRLRRCAVLLILLQLAIPILLYLSVSSVSHALSSVDIVQLFNLQTVEVRLSVLYGFWLSLAGELLLLWLATALPRQRAKAPQEELRPIL